jgi:hypothetical protein
MDVSDLIAIKEKLKIKIAKRSTPKKYFKKLRRLVPHTLYLSIRCF